MPTAQLRPPPAPTVGLADADITAAIETLLATRKGLTAQLITVQTRDGIVALSGFADNLLARQRAEEIALAVRGVRGQHSTLAIRTADVPDTELRHAVDCALADDAATTDYQVHCLVRQGVVLLSGLVQSWAEKQLVLRVVQGVHGVVAEQLTNCQAPSFSQPNRNPVIMKKNPLPTPVAPIVELATQAHEGTPQYGDYGHPATEPAPTLPPDVRAAGGNVYDLSNEQTTL